MGRTSIEWTDHSWPIVNGCRRVSPGCENCYAERLTSTRLVKHPKYKGLAVFGKSGPRWTGDTRLWLPHLDAPLHIRKPSRIFTADMGDLFYEGVTDFEIAAVFGVMAAAQRHRFQVLTKRPERAKKWFEWIAKSQAPAGTCLTAWAHLTGRIHVSGDEAKAEIAYLASHRNPPPWPLPNVDLGVSAENQEMADKRIPLLLEIPAALHWVSAEPLLGPIVLRDDWLHGRFIECKDETQDDTDPCEGCAGWSGKGGEYCGATRGPRVKWVVVGGESGPGARPFDLAWGESMVEQCEEHEVDLFMKQLGSRVLAPGGQLGWNRLADRKGGNMGEWPEGLRVRNLPAGAKAPA